MRMWMGRGAGILENVEWKGAGWDGKRTDSEQDGDTYGRVRI